MFFKDFVRFEMRGETAKFVWQKWQKLSVSKTYTLVLHTHKHTRSAKESNSEGLCNLSEFA